MMRREPLEQMAERMVDLVFGANEPALHSLHANWDAALSSA
jgi:hypothetical protein